MDQDTARVAVLDAAGELFYERGINAVGMDDIRAAAGVSLKRLYQLFPGKDRLVDAYLARRDEWWRARVAEHVAGEPDPTARLLAVFDWLETWFAEPGFRGCAWINSFGELGAVSPMIVERARGHKRAFAADLAALVAGAGLPDELTGELMLLIEGAMVTAAIHGDPLAARTAKAAAEALIGAGERGRRARSRARGSR